LCLSRDQLVGHSHVGLSANAQHIIEHDGLAKARSLGQAHVSGDDCGEDLRAKILTRVCGNLAGQVEARVVHGEEHAGNAEGRIDAVLDQVHGVEELTQTLERVVFALQRDEQRIGRREHVERDEAKRRRAVDEDEVVVVAHERDGFAHPALSTRDIDEFDLCPGKIWRCGQDIEPWELNPDPAGV